MWQGWQTPRRDSLRWSSFFGSMWSQCVLGRTEHSWHVGSLRSISARIFAHEGGSRRRRSEFFHPPLTGR